MIPMARDLMERNVVSVGPELSLLDVYRLFMDEEITGAPVIEEDGTLVGVISTSDLLRAIEEERGTARVETNYFRDLLPYSGPDWGTAPEDFQDRLSALRVSDAMTAEVVTIAPEMPAPAIARTLRERHIHRVMVAERNQLLGVISTFDLLRVVEDLKD
jgi:CBS domain-containing protein